MDSTIYAVYTDYASDRDGEYDLIIGMKVRAVSDVPPGMVVKKVPSGRYAIVTSAKGPAAQVVPQAWQQVWSLEDNKQLGGATRLQSRLRGLRPAQPEPAGLPSGPVPWPEVALPFSVVPSESRVDPPQSRAVTSVICPKVIKTSRNPSCFHSGIKNSQLPHRF